MREPEIKGWCKFCGEPWKWITGFFDDGGYCCVCTNCEADSKKARVKVQTAKMKKMLKDRGEKRMTQYLKDHPTLEPCRIPGPAWFHHGIKDWD